MENLFFAIVGLIIGILLMIMVVVSPLEKSISNGCYRSGVSVEQCDGIIKNVVGNR